MIADIITVPGLSTDLVSIVPNVGMTGQELGLHISGQKGTELVVKEDVGDDGQVFARLGRPLINDRLAKVKRLPRGCPHAPRVVPV